MSYQIPGRCNICGHDITITSYNCSNCDTRTEGKFVSCRFCRLEKEQLDFIEVFLKCRGNIKDMEKELGISYPTIRNRLEDALQSLGYKESNSQTQEQEEKIDSAEVLSALEKGQVTPQEALRILKKSKGKKEA